MRFKCRMFALIIGKRCNFLLRELKIIRSHVFLKLLFWYKIYNYTILFYTKCLHFLHLIQIFREDILPFEEMFRISVFRESLLPERRWTTIRWINSKMSALYNSISTKAIHKYSVRSVIRSPVPFNIERSKLARSIT